MLARLLLFIVAIAPISSGCGSDPGPVPGSSEPMVEQAFDKGNGSSADSEARTAEYFSCAADDDCVVVPRAGCCNNGWNEAVNRLRKAEYAEAHVCTIHRPICLMYLVQDRRVARCSEEKRACVLVGVDENPQSIDSPGLDSPRLEAGLRDRRIAFEAKESLRLHGVHELFGLRQRAAQMHDHRVPERGASLQITKRRRAGEDAGERGCNDPEVDLLK